MRTISTRFVIAGIIVAVVVVASGVGAWYILSDSSTTPTASPTCRLVQASETTLEFIIEDPDVTWITWDDVRVIMEASPNDPETYLEVNFWWSTDQENLTSVAGLPITQSLLQNNGSDLALFCNVTDTSGNGFVDDGDYLTLMPLGENALIAGVTYEIKLLNESFGSYMCSLDFVP